MSPQASDSKTSETTTENEQGATNGASRFSEDDMDTEIEVTPEEANDDKTKRKKKKKTGEGGERETSAERTERRKKKKERKEAKEAKKAAAEGNPPPYPYSEAVVNEEEAAEPEKATGKKREIKKNFSRLLDAPMLFIGGIIVCVILPFGIYACDVIISVNVIDIEAYKDAIISQDNDFAMLPNPEKLTGKPYTLPGTIFMTMQINTRLEAEAKKRRGSRAVSEVEAREAELAASVPPSAADEPATVTTQKTASPTTPPSTTVTTTLSTTSSVASSSAPTTESPDAKTEATDSWTEVYYVTMTMGESEEIEENATDATVNSTVVTTTVEPKNTTLKIRSKPPKFRPRPTPRRTSTTTVSTVPANTTAMDPEPWRQQDGEFCKGLYYFYELHHSYVSEYGSDWFDDQTYSAYQKEQALFFMFTILGFIFLFVSVGLRCDIFLSDEWSSFVMASFFLYSISMALTASVFGQESSNNGIRCATCRFTSNCSDIDPWDYDTHWPADPDNDRWSLVALLSFIFKLVDCYAIAIVTLKFIVDFSRDLWWVSVLKIVGWLIVFPLLIFTPMLGVIRYQVLPGVEPDDHSCSTAVEVLFFIGIAFWALCLAALPCFCKMRMCSGSEEEERNEEEEMDY